MTIDWSLMKTKEDLLQEESSGKITITRTQGLIWIFRNTGVKDIDILARISLLEDENVKYEAEKYFEASTWDSDNTYVGMIAESIGLDTTEKIRDAFLEAKEI